MENQNKPLIYGAVSKAMGEIVPIAKGQRNTQQNFAYRGIDDIMNELQPILKNNGLFIVPEVIDSQRSERVTKSGTSLIYTVLKIKYTVYASDGSNISTVVIGEGMDSGDKSSNKAMSTALKYAFIQIFCIPTAESKDPDGESHTVQPVVDKPAECKRLADIIGLSDAEKTEFWNKAGKNTDKLYELLRGEYARQAK